MFKKYRGLIIIALALIFNYYESLFFGSGTEIGFNHSPQSKAEFIADLMSQFILMVGLWFMYGDITKLRPVRRPVKIIITESRVEEFQPKPGDRFHSEFFDKEGTVVEYVHPMEWYFRLDGDDTVYKNQVTPDKLKWIVEEEIINDEVTRTGGVNSSL